MFPAKNGVQSPAEYSVRGDTRTFALLPDHCFSHVLVHLGLVQAEPNSSATLRARPLWSILGDAGISSGIVRWPLTSPAQPLVGFVLTDRFHELVGSLRELDDSAGYPEEVLPIARRAYAEATLPDGAAVPVAARNATATPEASAGQRDRFYSLAMRELEATWPVRFSALRFQALDTVGHYNLRYTQPRDVTGNEDDRRRRLQVVDRYYGDIDDEIGRQIGALVPGDLLLVVSGFGMESPSALKRLLARVLRDPMSGTHERAPDGFLLALRHDGRAGPPPARVDRRRDADGAVLPGPARCSRHGWLRASGPLPQLVHIEPPDCLRADIQRKVGQASVRDVLASACSVHMRRQLHVLDCRMSFEHSTATSMNCDAIC